MAIQYDAPTTKADFEEGVTANPSIDPETQAAINARLNITPETGGEEIEVASGQYDAETEEFVFTIPPGAEQVDALIVDTSTMPPGASIVFPEGLTEVPVVIFDSDEGLTVTFNTIERVIQMGNGDDSVNVTGDQDTTLAGGDGNDTLTTSAGDDSVSGGNGNDSIDSGAGNDLVRAGSGNDTIIHSSGADTIDGGLGFDNVEVGFAYDVDNVTITGDVLFSDGAGNSVQLDNVQFVSFSNDHTLTIMDEADQASAMRLYQTVLGRAADQPGAEFYLDEAIEVPDPALVVAAGMLGSDEFTATHGSIDEMGNVEFIELMYEQGLNREADPAGLEFYLEQLESGATKNQIAAEINAEPESVEVNMDTVILLDGWV